MRGNWPATRPWHIRIVALIALVWCAMAAVDFLFATLDSDSYRRHLTFAQRADLDAYPLWAMLSWGLKDVAGLAGALLLVMGKRQALPLFQLALAGAVILAVWRFVLASASHESLMGAMPAVFALHVYILLALVWYSADLRGRALLT